MRLTKFLPLIMLLLLCNTSYTQETSWVSVSNEFITIAVDKVSGRYIIYDSANNQPSSKLTNTFFPTKFLAPASPNDITLSPMLGDGTNAFNVTSFNINGNPVAFGSPSGHWVSPPKITDTGICYTWQIGSLQIIQRLEIITNPETLTPDAVEISYDVFNTHTQTQNIQTRMVLDTVVNDGQDSPFFLPNHQPIFTEYSTSLGALPEYWVTSDRSGNISSLSLKGIVSDSYAIKPNYMYLTTINRALSDIWNFDINRNSILSGKDVAIVLLFNNNSIYPNASSRVASTTVSIPSLMNTVQNNGLEVRTSSFVNQNTLPANVTLWIKNTSGSVFDSVELELQIPKTLRSYDPLKKVISNFTNTSPVTWRLDTDAKLGNNYNILATVNGYQGGQLVSTFDVPLLISIDPVQLNTAKELATTVQNAQGVTLTNGHQSISLTKGDTLGSTSDSLSKIRLHLQNNDNFENRQLIKIIDTEQLLMREILEIDKSLNEVDNQYSILIELYKRLYEDSSAMDREHINIQGLIDNIKAIESTLLQQEQMISDMISE